MVERSLSMREVPGSIPGSSRYASSFFSSCTCIIFLCHTMFSFLGLFRVHVLLFNSALYLERPVGMVECLLIT